MIEDLYVRGGAGAKVFGDTKKTLKERLCVYPDDTTGIRWVLSSPRYLQGKGRTECAAGKILRQHLQPKNIKQSPEKIMQPALTVTYFHQQP